MSITVKRDLSQPMRHLVHVRNHIVPTDVPVEDGGHDAGPSAHDLYDAALGACKALTLMWYARRKGIPVEDIEVGVERDDTGERDGVYRLATSIRLTGELTPEQRELMLAAARKCPVHKLMTSVRTEISTDFA